MTEKEKILLNVGVENNHDVLYCRENERSIASFWHEHDAEKVEVAINSYGQHVDLISKQAEQIKMLREALADIITKSEIFGIPSGVTVSIINGVKALSATEQK